MERFQYQSKLQYRNRLNGFYVEVYPFEESRQRQAVSFTEFMYFEASFYQERIYNINSGQSIFVKYIQIL